MMYVVRWITAACLLAPAMLCLPAGAREDGERNPHEPVLKREEAKAYREAVQLAAGDRPAAIEKLKSLQGERSSAALDFALGVFLMQEEKYEEAESAVSSAVAKFPAFTRAWEQLGRLKLLLDKPGEAAKVLRRAIEESDRPTAELVRLLGMSYLLSGKLVAAEFTYRQAVALDPDDSESLLGLAKTLYEAECYAQALPILRKLCCSHPDKAEYWLLQAEAHLARGEHVQALEILESARRLGLLTPDHLATLGDLYYNKGLMKQAVGTYEQAFGSGQVPPSRMLRAARALFQAGETESASRLLARVLESSPEEPSDAYLLAGQMAHSQGRIPEAIEALKNASESNPLNGEALAMLGELYWQTQDYDRAAVAFERAARVEGFEARALVLLAQMEVELDRFEKAVEHLEAAQEIRPNVQVASYLEQVRRLLRAPAPAEGR